MKRTNSRPLDFMSLPEHSSHQDECDAQEDAGGFVVCSSCLIRAAPWGLCLTPFDETQGCTLHLT